MAPEYGQLTRLSAQQLQEAGVVPFLYSGTGENHVKVLVHVRGNKFSKVYGCQYVANLRLLFQKFEIENRLSAWYNGTTKV